ncbi:MAG: hypothetical protein ACFE0P_02985 [Oceanicaulis sp.]
MRLPEGLVERVCAGWPEPRLRTAALVFAEAGEPEAAAAIVTYFRSVYPDAAQPPVNRAGAPQPLHERIADPLRRATRLSAVVGLFAEGSLDFPAFVEKVLCEDPEREAVTGLVLTRWHARRRDHAALIEAFGDVDWPRLCDPLSALQYFQALRALDRHDQARAFLDAYADAVGVDGLAPAMALERARYLVSDGALDRAEAELRGLLEGHGGPRGKAPAPVLIRARHLLRSLQRTRAGAPATLAEIEREIAAGAPDVSLVARRVRLLWRVVGLDAAEAALREALDAHPLSMPLLSVIEFLPLKERALQEILLKQLDHGERRDLAPGQIRALFEFCWMARLDEQAGRLAQRLSVLDSHSRLFLDGAWAWSNRLKEHWPENSFETAVGDRAGLTVVFVGYIRSRIAGMPRPVFDTWFARRGVPVVYCRDFQNAFFLRGLAERGPRFEDALDALREVPAVTNARRLLVIGVSGGGFPAIRFAHGLNAERCIVFSPKTTLAPLAGDVMDRSLTHCETGLSDLPHEQLDLASLWPASTPTRTDVYHGEVYADRLHAQRIASLAGVRVHEAEGVKRHDILGALLEDGRFDAILDAELNQERAPC